MQAHRCTVVFDNEELGRHALRGAWGRGLNVRALLDKHVEKGKLLLICPVLHLPAVNKLAEGVLRAVGGLLACLLSLCSATVLPLVLFRGKAAGLAGRATIGAVGGWRASACTGCSKIHCCVSEEGRRVCVGGEGGRICPASESYRARLQT